MENKSLNLGSFSHNQVKLNELNKIAGLYGESELLHILFQDYFDDGDINNIIQFLTNRLIENDILFE